MAVELVNVVVVESDVNGGVGVEICCKLGFKMPSVGLKCSWAEGVGHGGLVL